MPINVQFKVSGGTQFSMELEPAMTILEVKQKAEAQCNFAPEAMKIIYKGRILKNEDTLDSHKVEDGHSMHVVRGMSSAATAPATTPAPVATPAAPASGDASGPDTGMPGMGMPGMGMPGMAGGMPGGMAGGMPGGMDMNAMMQLMGGMGGGQGGMGGMGGMNPEMLGQMLQNPMIQQVMQQISQNPAMLQQMLQSNPMFQQMSQRDPMVAQMMQNPQVMQMMFNPQMLQGILRMQDSMGGGAGGMGQPATMPVTDGTAPGVPAGANAAAPGAPGANPFASMMNDPNVMQMAMQMMQGGGMPGGGMAAMQGGGMAGMPGAGMTGMPGVPAQADSRPPEERFATQLQQLEGMGFPDRPSNIQALQMANGDVNAAINFLCGGDTQ